MVNHGMPGSHLSQSDSAPSFSNDRAHGHQSTHNITTKFLSAEERFMFGIGMLLHWPVPLYHCSLTVSGRTPDRDERERTEKWNQVGSFLLKSRSFELIRSQTTHHWWQLRKLRDIIAARHSVVPCANKFCRCQKYLAGTVFDFFFYPPVAQK